MSNRFVTPLIRSVVVVTAFCLLFPAGSFAATPKIGGTGAALGTMRILADEFGCTPIFPQQFQTTETSAPDSFRDRARLPVQGTE